MSDKTDLQSTNIDSLQEAILRASSETEVQKEPSRLRKALRMWYRPFVLAHRIPVFKRVWLWVAVMAVYTLLVDWIAEENFPAHAFKEFGTVSSSGIILGLLLVFRTNSAYERWWEGRKLWGQLVNDSRNLCLKIRSIDAIRPAERIRFGELVISFSYALKHRLRNTVPSKPLPGLGNMTELEASNIPVHVASQIFDLLMRWRKEGQIDGLLALQLDSHAQAFMNICGSCERIKNSPIAISYRAFMRQGIALNLLSMPWYLSQQFEVWWCLPLVLISTYFLVGIELIAEDVEDPFGFDGDDLPLDNICAGIKETVGQILNVNNDSEFTRSMDLPRFDFLKEK
ncbi:MAG: bestrophin family protein [Candidatus Obscuribacterales bacterium]|nr:bestrophin family protein [Candidatus Obscuribacterales bacterium]